MHSFAETAPEITTATVKQVAEIVKTFQKKKSRWLDKNFLPPHHANRYSHRKMLPTRTC
jgi:hypothetical protein